jgi:aspartyl-tRNA(Asn)/glutamyl-tRNA(Gln) amidotransferase subunit A
MLDMLCGVAPRPYAPPPLAGLRVGVLERGFCEGLDGGVEDAFRAALDSLARAGARLLEVDLGWHEDPDVLRAIYDAEPLPTVAGLVQADPSAFGNDIRTDVERGLRVTALEYLEARERLEERRRRALEVLPLVAVVASPTVPLEAPPLDGPDLTTTLNRNTKPFNGLHWPALSLPCGLDSAGLPVGMQLAAGPGRDGELIAVALAVEARLANGWGPPGVKTRRVDGAPQGRRPAEDGG